MKKISYCRYRRAFGITLKEILAMPRPEFAAKFGKKFLFMGVSKFLKTISQIARAYERGEVRLRQYR